MLQSVALQYAAHELVDLGRPAAGAASPGNRSGLALAFANRKGPRVRTSKVGEHSPGLRHPFLQHWGHPHAGKVLLELVEADLLERDILPGGYSAIQSFRTRLVWHENQLRTGRKLLRHIRQGDQLAARHECLSGGEGRQLEHMAHIEPVILRRVDERQLRVRVQGPRHRQAPVRLLGEQDRQREHGVAVVSRLHVDEGHARRPTVVTHDGLAIKVLDLRVLPAAELSERRKTGPDDALDTTCLRGVDEELPLRNFLQWKGKSASADV